MALVLSFQDWHEVSLLLDLLGGKTNDDVLNLSAMLPPSLHSLVCRGGVAWLIRTDGDFFFLLFVVCVLFVGFLAAIKGVSALKSGKPWIDSSRHTSFWLAMCSVVGGVWSYGGWASDPDGLGPCSLSASYCVDLSWPTYPWLCRGQMSWFLPWHAMEPCHIKEVHGTMKLRHLNASCHVKEPYHVMELRHLNETCHARKHTDNLVNNLAVLWTRATSNWSKVALVG